MKQNNLEVSNLNLFFCKFAIVWLYSQDTFQVYNYMYVRFHILWDLFENIDSGAQFYYKHLKIFLLNQLTFRLSLLMESTARSVSTIPLNI